MIWPDVPCCITALADSCRCGYEERVLRAYSRKDQSLPEMTKDQRDWCLSEIGKVESYDWRDYEFADDAMLASGVLSAWTDFCRDKGLL